MLYNPELMDIAIWTLNDRMSKEKRAFTPPDAGGDPAAAQGGAPPMDPSMGGGMPPGGDPSGGMGGGPDIMTMIQTAVQQAVQQNMAGMGGGGGMGAAGGMGGGMAGGMKPAKPDINTVAMDVFQIKKMLTHFFNMQGIPLPPDILDGPNRNPSTGEPMPPGAPGSTSDPSAQQAQQSSIPPVQAMQGAAPMDPSAQGGGAPPGGGIKSSSVNIGSEYTPVSRGVSTKADALSHIIRQVQKVRGV